MPITPPPSRGASLCNTLLLDSICVCREVHKFLLALHWCRSAVEIFLGDYHTTIMLSRVEWSVLCTHTQTSQHIKHMFTIHKGSSLPEKSVLLWRDYPQPPPTQLSEDLNSVYLYNYYQEGSNMGHLVARAGAQIHNRWEN